MNGHGDLESVETKSGQQGRHMMRRDYRLLGQDVQIELTRAYFLPEVAKATGPQKHKTRTTIRSDLKPKTILFLDP